jgi:hypothetical protein
MKNSTNEGRILAHTLSRELSADEVNLVSGGITTRIDYGGTYCIDRCNGSGGCTKCVP